MAIQLDHHARDAGLVMAVDVHLQQSEEMTACY
jgi:hypothetical protein